jgi:hypothetical protein
VGTRRKVQGCEVRRSCDGQIQWGLLRDPLVFYAGCSGWPGEGFEQGTRVPHDLVWQAVGWRVTKSQLAVL